MSRNFIKNSCQLGAYSDIQRKKQVFYDGFIFGAFCNCGFGFIGDKMGLHAVYAISAVMGFLGIPFILMLPKNKI